MGRARGQQASGGLHLFEITRRSAPTGVSDLQLGPTTFSARIECDRCDSSFTASAEALGCEGFKADPDTNWFDGSATSVLKFYVNCPACRATIFVERDSIPVLVQQTVHAICAGRWHADYPNSSFPRL